MTHDVEYHGTTVPAGSAILLQLGSANRDQRRYADPDRFDIHRDDIQHLTFGYGLHFCLGAASPASRAASRSTRCSTASPSGRSTTTP